eukprot:gene7355-13086_t
MENENFRYKEICKLAAVSQRCFAQIMKIDEELQNGEMKKSTSAQKISLSTFDSLQGEKEDEQYRLLSAIVNGEATLKHLNVEKRQRRRRVATEQPSTPTTSSSAEGDMDALTFNSKRWKASEFSELNDQVCRLKGYIKTMKAELNDAEEEIRKNQRTIFNLEEEVKNFYDALKSRRTHFDEYRINVERRLQAKDKTIAELQSQLSSLTEESNSNLFKSRLLETNEMYNSTPEPKKLEEGNRKYTKSAFKALPFTDILEENSASTDASEMTSIIPGLQPFNLAFQKKKSLATVSTTAIDDDFEAYVAGSAELESSFAESEGDLCEESAAQGIELLQSLSFDYESDSEPSNDRKDKMILKHDDFVAYTCLTNTFYLGRVVLGVPEVAEDQVAVIYATARPNNMFDFNKKKTDVIKKQQIFKWGSALKTEFVKCGVWRVDRASLEKDHQIAVKILREKDDFSLD